LGTVACRSLLSTVCLARACGSRCLLLSVRGVAAGVGRRSSLGVGVVRWGRSIWILGSWAVRLLLPTTKEGRAAGVLAFISLLLAEEAHGCVELRVRYVFEVEVGLGQLKLWG
jgi:hypothetical protein